MKEIGLKLFLVFLLFCSTYTFASSVTATQNGNWSNTDTWGGNPVPDGSPCYDTIIIPAGISVTVDVMVNLTACPDVLIIVEGTLIFQAGKKIDLPDGSIVYVPAGGSLVPGGGGGNSNWITIAGDVYWNAGDGTMNGPGVLCQNCGLPIELINFSAQLVEGIVILNWQTASETGNDYFIVQRSLDGLNWENISVVDGAGNSSILIDYDDEDRYPYLGISYYRLKQVDFNGAFSYSQTEVISNATVSSDKQILVLSQTSSSETVIVVYFTEPAEGNVDLLITNISGQIIFNESRNTENDSWLVIHIDRPLASGIYIVGANRTIEKSYIQ